MDDVREMVLALLQLGMEGKEIAECIEVSQSTVTNYKLGRVKPNAETYKLLVALYQEAVGGEPATGLARDAPVPVEVVRLRLFNRRLHGEVEQMRQALVRLRATIDKELDKAQNRLEQITNDNEQRTESPPPL